MIMFILFIDNRASISRKIYKFKDGAILKILTNLMEKIKKYLLQ